MVFSTVRENKKKNKIEINQEDTDIVKNDDNNLISHHDKDSIETNIPISIYYYEFVMTFDGSM